MCNHLISFYCLSYLCCTINHICKKHPEKYLFCSTVLSLFNTECEDYNDYLPEQLYHFP